MNKKTLVIIMTLIVAIPAFLLGGVLWPSPIGGPTPTSTQLPLLILLSVCDSFLFGFGIALVVVVWPKLRRLPPEKRNEANLVFFSLIWSLISWWPHANLHRSVGLNLQSIIYVDYGFHLTLMLASLIVMRFFIKYLREKIV